MSSYDPNVETVEAFNARFDVANEAGQEVFDAAYFLGWAHGRYPGLDYDEAEAREEYNREVDGVDLGEAWEAHRDRFFARLPLAAVQSRKAP